MKKVTMSYITDITDDRLKSLREILREHGCINKLESMFSQKECAFCDVIAAIDSELLKRHPPSLADYGRAIRITKEMLSKE